jgi:hypothetical protein
MLETTINPLISEGELNSGWLGGACFLSVTQEVASSSLVGPANLINDVGRHIPRRFIFCDMLCAITTP